MKFIIIALLILIISSLFIAVVNLSKGRQEDKEKMARYLTIRIALSVLLFIIVLIAFYFGLIQPNSAF